NQFGEDTEREHNKGAKIKIVFPLPFCLYLKDGEYIINQNGEEIVLSLEKKTPETFDSRLGIELLKPDKIEDNKEYLVARVYNVVEESQQPHRLMYQELMKLKTKNDIMYLLDKKPEFKLIKGGELKTLKEGYRIFCIVSEEGNLEPPLCVLYMNCERKNDKKGYFRYTKVSVSMPLKKIEPQSINLDKMLNNASNAINRLIEAYRYITSDYYVERLKKEDIDVVCKHGEMEIYLNNEKISTELEMTPTLVPFIGDKKEDVHRRLEDFLTEDKPVPIFENIFLNAKDLLLKEDYRLAVLEAVIALEVYLHEFLENKFKNDKKYDEPLINHLLKRPDINLRLKELLELATGKKLHEWNKSLWDEWDSGKDGVKKLRNDITHRKKITVTPEEAKNAINTIEEIIRCIKKIGIT
ncbi:MAG: hypothetical protein KAT65_24425, partial [Methanophagales archaeon]|nr:hypothetical protein [Methanophagales archaeon]